MKALVHLFPGQGFQKVGMSQTYLTNNINKDLFQKLTSQVENLDSIICVGPSEILNQTQYTQPAIFIHSYLAFKSYQQKLNQLKYYQSFAIGHSVGEYSAFGAFNFINPEIAVKLLYKRGEIMNQASQNMVLGMLVVRSSNLEILKNAINITPQQNIDIALFNSQNQTVLSGERSSLMLVQKLLKEQKIQSLFLPVSTAFHNRILNNAANLFKEVLEETLPQQDYTEETKIISNYDCSFFKNRQVIVENLAHQFYSPVKFKQSVEFITNMDFESYHFIEYGSNILTSLVKDILLQNCIQKKLKDKLVVYENI